MWLYSRIADFVRVYNSKTLLELVLEAFGLGVLL
jgi:hypothetical protein